VEANGRREEKRMDIRASGPPGAEKPEARKNGEEREKPRETARIKKEGKKKGKDASKKKSAQRAKLSLVEKSSRKVSREKKNERYQGERGAKTKNRSDRSKKKETIGLMGGKMGRKKGKRKPKCAKEGVTNLWGGEGRGTQNRGENQPTTIPALFKPSLEKNRKKEKRDGGNEEKKRKKRKKWMRKRGEGKAGTLGPVRNPNLKKNPCIN